MLTSLITWSHCKAVVTLKCIRSFFVLRYSSSTSHLEGEATPQSVKSKFASTNKALAESEEKLTTIGKELTVTRKALGSTKTCYGELAEMAGETEAELYCSDSPAAGLPQDTKLSQPTT